MINTICRAAQAQNIRVYSITETLSESAEFYFIRRNLDMSRRTKVHTYQVTVFRDFEENGVSYRGRASVMIDDSMGEGQIEDKLAAAYYSASFAKIRWYPLPCGVRSKGTEDSRPELADHWDQMGLELAQAAFEAETEFAGRQTVFLNSLEVFAKKTTTRLVNSEGTDVAYIRSRLNGEVVAQCPEPQDVETYESFSYEELDEDAVKAKVAQTLSRTLDRSAAVNAAPAGQYRLILSDQYVSTVMNYFKERSHASLIYQRYSAYHKGDCVQDSGDREPVRGDLLQMWLTATDPYSDEGIMMKDRTLLTDGVLQTIHGGSRFCYYLDTEPTGDYEKITVGAGRVSFNEMKKTPYLHVVNFSDFQMDALTGNFGGEIRLAYLYDGHQIRCVTGGSVNGSILTAQKYLTLSRETQNQQYFSGPLAVSIEGVTVAGT